MTIFSSLFSSFFFSTFLLFCSRELLFVAYHLSVVRLLSCTFLFSSVADHLLEFFFFFLERRDEDEDEDDGEDVAEDEEGEEEEKGNFLA